MTRLHRLGLVVLIGAALGLSATAWAAGVAPQPTICERACWEARAPQCAMDVEPGLDRAIIHHTASSSDYDTDSLEYSAARVRAHQNYHMDSLGWCDIGYHFLVDKLGNTFEGREGSMTIPVRGAHDGCNNTSFGFSAMGYFHSPYDQVPTPELRGALYDVIAWRIPDPFTGLGSGTYCTANVGFLDGHRSVTATDCPGDLLFAYIGTNFYSGEARTEVYVRISGGATPPPPPEMFVQDIAMAKVKSGQRYKAVATILVKDTNGSPVPGAVVTGAWSGATTGTASGTTAADGTVSISSAYVKSGTFTFCVTSIAASGYVYDSTQNVETCASITAP